MLVSNLSTDVSPCWLLQANECTIMLDCPLNLSPLYQSRFIGKSSAPRFKIVELDRVCDLASIDAILISNYQSFMGLPWLTESGSKWSGTIYCTKPTLEFARINLKQLRAFCDEAENKAKASQHKNENGNNLKMVTTSQIESCLARVELINFGETLSIFGAASITPQSSGYSIGSCIWIIEITQKKIIYMNDYSNLRTHCAKSDIKQLGDADLMILSGCKSADQFSPDKSVHDVNRLMIEALKNQENVMFPVSPSGIILDLLEIVMDLLDRERLGSVPIYYIAPFAKDALAHAQIYPEFLSQSKQARASVPEFPFLHEEAIQTGKLKVFSHSTEGLSDHFRGPAVIFTGHPSLELGEAATWAEKWISKGQNKILVTEPDLPQSLYRDRGRSVHYLPIDTRLTHGGAKMLLDDLRPKELIISQKLNPLSVKLSEISDLKITQIAAYKTYACNVDTNASVSVMVDPKLASTINLLPVGDRAESQLCQLSGVIRVTNNKYELNFPSKTKSNIRPIMLGHLESQQRLIHHLTLVGIKDTEIEKNEIIVPGGRIRLNGDETTIVHPDETIRAQLITALRNSLLLEESS